MKINRLIFAIVLIALCMATFVELKRSRRAHSRAQSMEMMASQIAAQFKQQPGPMVAGPDGKMRKDIFAWKRDKFLRPLKDENKWKRGANTVHKWKLFQFLVGKVYALMGLDPTAVYKWVTQLSQPQLMKNVVAFMRFQQKMNFDELKVLLDQKNKPPGFNAGTLMPTFKERIMTFLDAHIRKRPVFQY